jgi:hypothetical protein
MAFITRQETTSKNVLDEALRDTILGGFTAQMTDDEIQKYAEALLAPQKNAALEASQQSYEASKLGYEQEMENLAVQLADAIGKQQMQYGQNIAGLETSALARGMGRSSYLLNTEAALSQALAETIKNLSNENTRQTAQIQRNLTLAEQQNAQTQGRINTDYATQLAAKVQELKQNQRAEYNQNYMSAVSSALGSNSETLFNPEYLSTTPLYVGSVSSGSSGGGSSKKKDVVEVKTNTTPQAAASGGSGGGGAGKNVLMTR